MNSTKWPSKLVAPVGYPIPQEFFNETKSLVLNPEAACMFDYAPVCGASQDGRLSLHIGMALAHAPEAFIDELIVSGVGPKRVDKFCSMCDHFNPVTNSSGLCHKNPPRNGHDRPTVNRGDWCGQFVRRGVR